VAVDMQDPTRPGVWLLSTTTAKGYTTPEQDARAIFRDLLRPWGLDYDDIDYWVGDRSTNANQHGVRKGNMQIKQELARLAGIRVKEAKWIETPKKWHGSVTHGFLSLEEASSMLTEAESEQPETLQNAQWERLLVCGGFPSVWFDPEPQTALRKMVSAELLGESFEQHAIGRPSVFRKLLEIAASESGRMVNISEWASAAKASRTTVMRYVEIAEQAHLLHLLPPFTGGKRAEVTGASKVCFIDNGVRNAFFGGFLPSRLRGDGNALWQNAVYGELRKRLPVGCDIRYWRSRNGAEIDFMIKGGDKVLALEVRSRPLRQPKLTRGVRGFLEIYQPDCLGVLNKSVRHDMVDHGVDVMFRRPWELDELLDIVRL
jgi:hypothetical protein